MSFILNCLKKTHSIIYFRKLYSLNISSMSHISVIWHQNPDTDATLSAIIAAEYLQKKWYNAIPYILGSLNNETKYILEKYGIDTPVIKQNFSETEEIFLVDHNELTQSAIGITEQNIVGIIDHHKIQFESSKALYIRIEALCSTASILYKLYEEAGFEISKNTALMMLACIMSDSLMWKSPTSTGEDKVIASQLQKIAEINDLETFAMDMFAAKSDLGDMPAKDIVHYDYKNFEFDGKKIWVGTLETTNPEYALGRKDELLAAMEEIKEEEDLYFIMLSVVDIIGEKNSTLVLSGWDSDILRIIFEADIIDNIADLGARLSRKKQIVPELTHFFEGK